MKKLLMLAVMLFFIGCSGYNKKKPTLDNFGASFSNNLKKPSETKVIILPTSVSGHPDIEYSQEDTQKVNIALKNLNYTIVDILFVEDWLIQNEIFDPKNASLSELKKLQEHFNGDAIVISNVKYEYIPSTEFSKSSSFSQTPSNDVNVNVNVDNDNDSNLNLNTLRSFYNNKKKNGFSSSGSKSQKIGEHYRNTFSSIKLMDIKNQIVLYEIFSKSGKKFQDIYEAIEKHYNPKGETNTKQKSFLEKNNISYFTFGSINIAYDINKSNLQVYGDLFHFRPIKNNNLQFKIRAYSYPESVHTNYGYNYGNQGYNVDTSSLTNYYGIGYFKPMNYKIPFLKDPISFSANTWIYFSDKNTCVETSLEMESAKFFSFGFRPELGLIITSDGDINIFTAIHFLEFSFGNNF